MAQKTWKDIIAELQESTSTTFSEKAFEDLVAAYANDRDWEVGRAKLVGGELVTETIKPSEFITKLVRDILVYGGVDSQEAATLAADYQFKNMKGVYNFVSEAIFGYVETGKSFRFGNKEDFVGSLKLRDREESVTEHTNPQDKSGKKIKVKKQKHRTLVCKSSAPDWLKSTL